jgi:hypothetical protein
MAGIVHNEQGVLVVVVVYMLQYLKVQAHLRIAIVFEPRNLTAVPKILRKYFLEPSYLRVTWLVGQGVIGLIYVPLVYGRRIDRYSRPIE